jgi:coproporphyrinogen III oxidase-like Fe-S oxidoreductase
VLKVIPVGMFCETKKWGTSKEINFSLSNCKLAWLTEYYRNVADTYIPFCKCHYCDFHFDSMKKKEEMVLAIVKELQMRQTCKWTSWDLFWWTVSVLTSRN